MTLDEMQRTIFAIASANPPAWTGAMDPLIDVITDFAKAGRVRQIAEAYAMVKSGLPEAELFLMHCLPSIVVGYHPQIATRMGQFAAFEEDHPYWTAELQKAVHDPERFCSVVGALITRLDACGPAGSGEP